MNVLFKYNSYFQNMYFLSLFILFYSSQHDFGQKKMLAKWHHAPDGGRNTRY